MIIPLPSTEGPNVKDLLVARDTASLHLVPVSACVHVLRKFSFVCF